MVDEPANESKPWLNRFEDKLDRVVGLLRDLQGDAAHDAAAADVRLRLDALAARLRLLEGRRRKS